MKIIIVGMGQTGKMLAVAASKEHHEVVVVDVEKEIVDKMTDAYNVNGVTGSGGSRNILMQAGAQTADLLVALTPHDELNILACMTAKKLGTRDTSARIHRPEFDEDAEYIKKEYNIDRLLNPEKEAAKEMLWRIGLPGALRTQARFEREVIVSELEIEENGVLVNMPVNQVKEFFGTDMLVVTIRRKNAVIIPDGSAVIRGGDKIDVVVPVKSVRTIFKKLHMKRKQAKSIFMVGCGTTGYYLAKELQDYSYSLKILEKDKQRGIELTQMLPRAQVVYADAVDPQVLEEEGIKNTDVCISVTGNDRTNLSVSLFAHSEGVPQVLAKINESSYEQLLKKTDISTCVSPGGVIVEALLSVIRNMDSGDQSWIKKMYRIADGKAEAIAFEVSDHCSHLDMPFCDPAFRLKKGILVAAIIRGKNITIPDGKSSIQAGDIVVVVSDADNMVKDIEDIFVK